LLLKITSCNAYSCSLAHFTTELAAFHMPQDCTTWEHYLPLFATTAHIFSAIFLDKPVPSCIPRRKNQMKYGLVISKASPAILLNQSNNIHSSDSNIVTCQ
jgi:hypothetical protein